MTDNMKGWSEVDMSGIVEEQNVRRESASAVTVVSVEELDIFVEGLLSTGHSAGFLADEFRRDGKLDLAAWCEGRESAYLAAAARLREILRGAL